MAAHVVDEVPAAKDVHEEICVVLDVRAASSLTIFMPILMRNHWRLFFSFVATHARNLIAPGERIGNRLF
jgi:hypothetical protein